jgi:DNA-binding MarR family transcriptional regulator
MTRYPYLTDCMYMQTISTNERPTASQHADPESRCLLATLRQTARIVSRIYEEELRTVGFSRGPQYTVLRVLNAMGEVRQVDLGRRMELDQTTLTRTLKPLLAHGWVKSAPGQDRREKLISLTVAGQQQLLRGHPAWKRAQARIKAKLPAGAWEKLMGSLGETIGILGSP